MNIASQHRVRNSNVLASIASESLGKIWHESQQPLSSWTERHLRTERPVLDAYSSNYSVWNADKNWSFHVEIWWIDGSKNRETCFRTNHPVCSQSAPTDFLLLTIWTRTPSKNQTFRQNLDHSWTGWMNECPRFKTNPQKMQHKTATNIL